MSLGTSFSEMFRVGVRESRAAMSRGGLMAMLNAERAEHVGGLLGRLDAHEISGLLHDMSGPFNFRLHSGDIDSKLVHSAERVSSLAAMTIVADVHRERGAGAPAATVVAWLIDGFCAWIDTGVATDSIAAHDSESGKAAALMASTANLALDSELAANVRMLAVSRFAAALGSIDVVIRVPGGVLQPKRGGANG